MKQQDVFNKISGILKELNDQYKYLEADPGKINALELELFVANTHFLANHAEVLRKANIQANIAKRNESKSVKHEEKFFEPLVQQPEEGAKEDNKPAADIDIASDTPKDEYNFIRKDPPIIRHELEMDESWDDYEEVFDESENEEIAPEQDEPINEEITPGPEETASEDIAAEQNESVKTEATPEPIAETPPAPKQTDEPLTVNQKISAQLGNKHEAVLQPINDLKAAITLNDKLLYVKDLFNGYSLAYSEAVEILNRFKGFEEADNFLKKNYATKNNWQDKPDTAEKFYTLLRRRYS